MPPSAKTIVPVRLAASVRTLLLADPRRYRNFGAYWFVIKTLLKEHYSRDELPLLGDYDDPSVTARLPAYPDQQALLHDAIAAYRHNAKFNMHSSLVSDPQGETFMLFDEDMGI